MFFTDISFFIFLPITVLFYWLLPRSVRYHFLLIASYLFYGYVVPWTIFIIGGVTIINWWSALLIEKYPAKKRGVLWVCTTLSLSFLIWFKYALFILGNLSQIFPSLHLSLQIFLPAGISFFTFQALAYTVDVYRGTTYAEKSLARFALFISLFPQLVAGPIERSDNLLKQLGSFPRFNREQFFSGIDLLFIGYVKKVVVADNVALYVNMIFDLKNPSPLTMWIGGIGFGIQILADFSAYTDIARGCGRMLGFELLENFNHPYLARSPSEFWKRWHITLSHCIREYIYVPLGGSRVSSLRWIWNILFVWFLCGLWHGAGWNFIAWGLYWGMMLIVYKYTPSLPQGRLLDTMRICVMYQWITFGWILFRVRDLSLLPSYISVEAFNLVFNQLAVNIATLGIFLLYASPLIIALCFKKTVIGLWSNASLRPTMRTIGYGIASLLILIFASEQGSDFYYFQF